MLRLPPSLRRIAALTLFGLVPAAMAAALMADNEPANLVSHGDFEASAVNLRLPAVSPFPLVAGGWGGRGGESRDIVLVRDPALDRRSLELTSTPDDPVHVLQDIPLGTRSFVLEMSVRRVRGRQSLRLTRDWDRMDPESGADGLVLQLGASGLRVRTAMGAWIVGGALADGAWVRLRLIADARRELLEVWLDDRLAATLPGLPEAPRTLILGGNAARAESVFRYDDVAVFRLAELELARLRRDARRLLPSGEVRWVDDRLSGAALALERGDTTLAAPEVRAATRLLERMATAADAEPALQRLAADAIRLSELLTLP